MVSRTGTNNETDAQLVARMHAGDIAAFETSVERYRAVLIARAHARLGSFADAEDVAQEAFVQAYLHLRELRNPQAFLPWLRRITDRLALMHLRGRREQPVAPADLEGIIEQRAEPITITDNTGIEYLLISLPVAMREAISLTILAGYTIAEAASIMGVKEGTVKSRLNRARVKLKEVWGMTEGDLAGRGSTSEFTRQTIERLKREARQLLADGEIEEACRKASEVLNEQVKPLFGDPQQLGLAKTMLAAFDNAAFKPDKEAVSLMGISRKEQRRRECIANAAQYGFSLEELDWVLADVDVISGTLGKPTGYGQDIWGVPVSRMPLTIVDARTLCQRLRVSPLILYLWIRQGCPILRCWPFARFDVERVERWLAEEKIHEWTRESEYDLERPIRIIFRSVFNGEMTAEHAEEMMQALGYGIWEAPMSILKGGW